MAVEPFGFEPDNRSPAARPAVLKGGERVGRSGGSWSGLANLLASLVPGQPGLCSPDLPPTAVPTAGAAGNDAAACRATRAPPAVGTVKSPARTVPNAKQDERRGGIGKVLYPLSYRSKADRAGFEPATLSCKR